MAETKAAAKKRKPNSSRSKPKAGASSSKPKRAHSTKAKKRSTGKSRGATSKPRTSASKPVPSKPQVVLESVEESAKDAGGKVASVASKAKVPLLAGGAALAAGAGGLALGARQAHRKSGLGGISSKDVAKAARKVGDVGAQVGEVALEVRRARQATNGNGKVHRSPIEVVLQGLTQRRPHD
jgi:hypothetical protein